MIPLLAAPDFMPALPEIFLGAAAMALLLLGVHQGDRAAREILWLSVGALAVALALVLAPLAAHGPARIVSMFGMFVTDGFGAYAKVIVILGAAFSLVIALAYNDTHGLARPEYPVLVLFGTTGMMMMISANDLIALYLALELQSLSLYVLASFARDSDLSTEAGLKYFVLGALASGMLLYGASLVYGFAGSTNFDTLAQLFANGGTASVGLVVGIVFIAVGLAFKCSAVPFHMWTPDVYQGAPTPVTAFFSVAPKTAAIVLFVRVMVGPFGGLVTEWRQVIWFIAVASMLLGAFAAINQRNIKRLMAYSSIGHVGYALIGLAAGSPAGVRGVLVYMAIYLFMNIGTFAVILCMKRDGRMIEEIDDLAGLSRTQPALALGARHLHVLDGGHPALGRVLRQDLCLPRGDRRGPLRARRDRRAGERGGRLLLPPHRQAHVFRRARVRRLRPSHRPRDAGRPPHHGGGDPVLLRLSRPRGGRRGSGRGGALRRMIVPRPFRLHAFERIDSTNEEARRLAADGAPEFTLVLAAEQSAGRGRRGRAWQSPAGNLYCSLLLRPSSSAADAAQFGFAASLAAAETACATHFLPKQRRRLRSSNGRTTCCWAARNSRASCSNRARRATGWTIW